MMRALKRGIKGLMYVLLMVWIGYCFFTALNGVLSGASREAIGNTLLMFSGVTGLFEALLGVGVLIINEIER